MQAFVLGGETGEGFRRGDEGVDAGFQQRVWIWCFGEGCVGAEEGRVDCFGLGGEEVDVRLVCYDKTGCY